MSLYLTVLCIPALTDADSAKNAALQVPRQLFRSSSFATVVAGELGMFGFPPEVLLACMLASTMYHALHDSKHACLLHQTIAPVSRRSHVAWCTMPTAVHSWHVAAAIE